MKIRYSPKKTRAGAAVLATGLAILSFSHIDQSQTSGSLGRLLKSINLGGGNCKWQPPLYDVPDNETYYKTLLAGFPSGDKRMAFVQMEVMTGLAAKDEWDFEYLGNSNHPFIKANYPHHEGIWGWGDNADQVILILKSIRSSMVEYHDVLWDIGYAKTWAEASAKISNLYQGSPPIEDFIAWRDERVMEEIDWYGWFIDYYMEGGLMRDIFTHKITTPKHWNMLMVPTAYARWELDYNLVVGNETVTPSYDPHCQNDMQNGCEPVLVISGEKLVDPVTGPIEGAKITSVLEGKLGMDIIESEARECIWRELIVNKKGVKTFLDRGGREGVTEEQNYNFTAEMLQAMITELERLITKYSGEAWSSKQTATDLVALLEEHKGPIQMELDAMQAAP